MENECKTPIGILYSFPITNIFYDKMDLMFFLFSCDELISRNRQKKVASVYPKAVKNIKSPFCNDVRLLIWRKSQSMQEITQPIKVQKVPQS